jgi:hypothetical protein
MLGGAPGLFNVVDGVVEPFGHLVFGAGDQASSEAGEAHGDLSGVDHHPYDRCFVDDVGGEAVEAYLVVGVIAVEVVSAKSASCCFLVLHVIVACITDQSIEVSSKPYIVRNLKRESEFDRGLSVSEYDGLARIIFELLKIPHYAANEGIFVFEIVLARPRGRVKEKLVDHFVSGGSVLEALRSVMVVTLQRLRVVHSKDYVRVVSHIAVAEDLGVVVFALALLGKTEGGR